MNGTFLQLHLSKVSSQHQIIFTKICNTYDFDDITILVVWPKSAILVMSDMFLTSVPNFISI